ncbi:MAG: hypothetical protein FWF79_00930 [Defluviitaleaceae bacterium]|nr:hypothetical protein [Defluviitaleaceae bacterium]
MNKEILQQAALLHPEEIMHPYSEIMGLGGFDAICAFSEHLSGQSVYVPSLRTIFFRCLEEEARKEYNGHNSAMLSKKYGFTERHFRRILGRP